MGTLFDSHIYIVCSQTGVCAWTHTDGQHIVQPIHTAIVDG